MVDGRREGGREADSAGGTYLLLSTAPATSSPLAHLIFLSATNKKNNLKSKRGDFQHHGARLQYARLREAQAPVPVNVSRLPPIRKQTRVSLTPVRTQHAVTSFFSRSEQLKMMRVEG